MTISESGWVQGCGVRAGDGGKALSEMLLTVFGQGKYPWK